MDLTESLIKVMHGSTVLVNIGDPMWSPVTVDGEQLVQVAAYLRGAGVDAIPRGNESNTITWELAVEHDSVEEAVKAEFSYSLSLPRTKGILSLSFEDTSGVKISRACIKSWSNGHEGTISKHRVTVVGGLREALP